MRLNFIVSHLIEFSHVSIRSEFVTMDRTVFLFIQYFGRYSLVNSATLKKHIKNNISALWVEKKAPWISLSDLLSTRSGCLLFALDSILGFRSWRFSIRTKILCSDYWRSDLSKVDTFQNDILWGQKKRVARLKFACVSSETWSLQ